jgi:hypothetical protein
LAEPVEAETESRNVYATLEEMRGNAIERWQKLAGVSRISPYAGDRYTPA